MIRLPFLSTPEVHAPADDTTPPQSVIAALRRELAGAFSFAATLTLFINLAMLFVPLYSMILFDRVMQSRSYDTLTMLSIVCACGMLVYGALEYGRSLVFMVIADRLARRLSIPALRASISRSLSGDPGTAGQALRDLDSLRAFASGSAPSVPLDLAWTPMLLIVLYLLHPWYGHFGLLAAGLLVVLSLANDFATRAPLMDANKAEGEALGALSSRLRQRELIDGLGMLPEVARHWVRQQHKLLRHAAIVTRTSARFSVGAKVARLGLQAGAVAVGVILVVHNEASPGSLLGASLLMGKVLLPFEQLIGAWRGWTAAFAAWARVTDVLAHAAERAAGPAPANVEGRLTFENVTFAPGTVETPIVDDVSLTIEPGEVVALVGPSGSGKSTLARLAMGIIAPTSGTVRLDGLPTLAWDRSELARHAGYLAQSVGLLDGTILENIARMQADDPAAAIAAASRAGVHDLIGRLPHGYATQVGDAGQALPGGARQRIALARALYGQPKILVLDEPNANLDHEGEQSLIQAIRDVKASGTGVLLITHRPSILAAVDRVVAFDKGRIIRIEDNPQRPAPQHEQANAPMVVAGAV